MGKRIAGFGRTDSAGRSGFGAARPKPAVGRRPEDMGRRIAPRPEDSMRLDLRNMNPGKKYGIVKPIGNPNKKYPIVKPIGKPNKQYMIKPARY